MRTLRFGTSQRNRSVAENPVTAFALYLNGILDKDAELNEATLPRVRMPNRNGFVPDSRPDVK